MYIHTYIYDVEITIIEQLKGSSNLTEEQQMLLLKNMEIFWQNKLETLVPNGLYKSEFINIVIY